MAEKQQQRKMVDIDVVETSGVDHPAHLAEGWIVCKSATAQDVEGIFGPLVTEGTAKMANTDPAAPTVEDLTKALAAKDQELAAAKDALEKATKPAEEQEDVLKALPAEVRAMLKQADDDREALRKQADADRAELQKERDARLDERAVTETRSLYKSVSIDADTVGPALRRLALIDEGLHKSVTEALKAADAQLEAGNLFKSIGDNGINNDAPALGKLDAAAAELMKSDSTLTKPMAIAKAVSADPSLYEEYQNEKAGK
jgi:small-conductance mechanosensitive channel